MLHQLCGANAFVTTAFCNTNNKCVVAVFTRLTGSRQTFFAHRLSPHHPRSECASVSSVIDAFRYGAGGRWRQGGRTPRAISERTSGRPVCVPKLNRADARRVPRQLEIRETRSADYKTRKFPATFCELKRFVSRRASTAI